jgi:hypothetical protein
MVPSHNVGEDLHMGSDVSVVAYSQCPEGRESPSALNLCCSPQMGA